MAIVGLLNILQILIDEGSWSDILDLPLFINMSLDTGSLIFIDGMDLQVFNGTTTRP